MWTPKRVIMLGLGAVLFLAGYFVYAFFLGDIDGLYLLPEGFYPGAVVAIQDDPTQDSEIDKKLRMAFGRECEQVKKRIKFEVRKKGLVIAAAETSFKEPDGRVKLTDVSVALFNDQGDRKFPEINSITCDTAFLSFDEPISSPTDLGKGKIIGGELRGHTTTIINNRATPEGHDDLEIVIKSAPIFFDDRTNRIWTDGYVTLLDKQTRPDPTKISGHGMELQLTKETSVNKKQSTPQQAKSDLNGVDRIILKSTVEMHLYPDASSGFMTGSSKQAAPDPKKTAEKSHVVIRTQGQFTFDVAKDIAHFASPVGAPNQSFPDQVEVIREPVRDQAEPKGGERYDQLLCDHLTLKFRRKAAPVPATPASKTSSDREIESAHATARAGMEVVLSLDSENLACHCAELIFNCATGDRGSRTELRGTPLEAVRDGHLIKARKLELIAANAKGQGQQVVAEGPGQVDLCDKNPGKGHTTHAIWKGLLRTTKYKEGDRELDLLTLTEDAAFIDDEHGQKLYGQRLQVWLETTESPNKATPASPKQANSGGNRQRPTKVVASERVRAESPDFNIRECTNLTIRFKDDPRTGGTLPVVEALPQVGAQSPQVDAQPPTSPMQANSSPVPAQTPAKQDNKTPEKQKKPIDLTARDVAIDILRSGEKNDLQELVAFGNVHCHQEGEKKEDKGVDIRGETLILQHYLDGDVLKVFGDKNDPGRLQLGELFLLGPKVTIDQRNNTAIVDGAGGMHMPSNTTFEGGKPSKPGARLTVHWTHDMIFTGQDADFNGGVVAYQDGAEMQCKTLQVALDRRVSLKEGQKNGQTAKVERVIAHHKVWILDVVKDNKDAVVSQRLLRSHQIEVDNAENRVNASGPGSVSTLQMGSPEGLGQPGNPKGPKQPAKSELMLTRVEFQDQMISTTAKDTGARRSRFLGNIQVVHVPADNLEAKVDVSQLPKGGMLLRCDVLTVVGKQMPDGTTKQAMQAERRVSFRNGDVSGYADVLIFDETNDIVVFKGSLGNPAKVYQQVGGPGGKLRETQAGTILYNRKTNTVTADEVKSLNGSLNPNLAPGLRAMPDVASDSEPAVFRPQAVWAWLQAEPHWGRALVPAPRS